MSVPVENADVIAANDKLVVGKTGADGIFVAEIYGDRAGIHASKPGYIGNYVEVPLPYTGVVTIPIKKVTPKKRVKTLFRYDIIDGFGDIHNGTTYLVLLVAADKNYAAIYNVDNHELVAFKPIDGYIFNNGFITDNYIVTWGYRQLSSGAIQYEVYVYRRSDLSKVFELTTAYEISSVYLYNEQKLYVLYATNNPKIYVYDVSTGELLETRTIASNAVPGTRMVYHNDYLWTVYSDGTVIVVEKREPETLDVVDSHWIGLSMKRIHLLHAQGTKLYIGYCTDEGCFDRYTAILDIEQMTFIKVAADGIYGVVAKYGNPQYLKFADIYEDELYIDIYDENMENHIESYELSIENGRFIAAYIGIYIYAYLGMNVGVGSYKVSGIAKVNDTDLGMSMTKLIDRFVSSRCHYGGMCYSNEMSVYDSLQGLAYIPSDLSKFIFIDNIISYPVIAEVKLDKFPVEYTIRDDLLFITLSPHRLINGKKVLGIRTTLNLDKFWASILNLETLEYEDILDITDTINALRMINARIVMLEYMEDAIVIIYTIRNTPGNCIIVLSKETGEKIYEDCTETEYMSYVETFNKKYVIRLEYAYAQMTFSIIDIYTGNIIPVDVSWAYMRNNVTIFGIRAIVLGKRLLLAFSAYRAMLKVINSETGTVEYSKNMEFRDIPTPIDTSFQYNVNNAVIYPAIVTVDYPSIALVTVDLISGESVSDTMEYLSRYTNSDEPKYAIISTINGYIAITGDKTRFIDIFDVARTNITTHIITPVPETVALPPPPGGEGGGQPIS